MRSKRLPFNLALLCCLFALLWSCIEYTITTQVMPDGRIIRSVTVKGDSASIFRGSFRVPADSDWNVTTRYEKPAGKDSVMGTVFVYEARKEFSDYRALNSIFYRDSAVSDHMIAHVSLTKKQKGFFTHFEYTETYNQNAFDDFCRKFKAPALAPETFANQVLMPGMIIHANTVNIMGNLAIWNFKIGDFYASDYVMTVHSRMVNKIAVVIAGIILVILVGLILMRMFRK